MARGVRCAVCRHVEVAKIDMLRAGGASFRSDAAKFPPLHRDQLYRHWKHVQKARRLALVAGPGTIEEMVTKAAGERPSPRPSATRSAARRDDDSPLRRSA
jgi:hypothetical protein